ncbi:MAG: penicillin-binding protein 1B, partial [Cellvibrionaceae bacterium]
MPRKRRKARKRKSSFITFSAILRLGLVLILIFIAWAAYLDLQVRQKFDGKKWAIPARVFAQPLEIYEGLSLSPSFLEEALKSLGYKPVLQLQGPGQFTRRGPHYQVFTKGFSFWDKQQPPETYELTLEEGLVTSLSGPEDAFLLRLEPQEIGSIYPGHGEDRILVRLGSIPPLLGETLITVEDKDFANHYGLSLKSIARAALANLKAGNFVQGGSTITQQLVKNFYLTHERSLWRKVQEAMMSVLLELHYSKAEILEAYINEVYMGQSGPRSIHGFSLASQHYFNQPLQNLKPHQVALLVGVVKGASYYNPWNYPERTKSRRDLVLQLMADGGLIDESTRIRSQQLPLGLSQSSPRQQGNYPAYVDLVKRQLLRDYLIEDLQSEGLR